MTAVSLTPAQRAILEHAVRHAEGRIDWFPRTPRGTRKRSEAKCWLQTGLSGAWDTRTPSIVGTHDIEFEQSGTSGHPRITQPQIFLPSLKPIPKHFV